MQEAAPGAKTEVRMKPCPRVLSHRDDARIDAFLYMSVRNNLYLFRLGCAVEDFPQAEPDMFAAVKSFSAKVELWPAIPKGYETSQEGPWLIARAPAVKGSIAPLVATLKDTEKRFRRDHGPLPKSDAPIVVLVHDSERAATAVAPDAADGNEGFWPDPRHRRLFSVPVGKDDLERQGWLAETAHALLFFARYGDTTPAWIYKGERAVARAEAMTGKPLPSLHEGFVAWVSTLKLHTLDEHKAMEALDKPDWATLNTECFFYVAMLREGKYKKQYRAFLDDYAETGDGAGAFDRHIAPIDQEELRKATNEYISRIREVKPEKK